jgi:hypothetical protein
VEYRFTDTYQPYDGLGALSSWSYETTNWNQFVGLGGQFREWMVFEPVLDKRRIRLNRMAQAGGATASGATVATPTIATTLTLTAVSTPPDPGTPGNITPVTATSGTSQFAATDVGRFIVAGSGRAEIVRFNSATNVTVYIHTAFASTSITSGGWYMGLALGTTKTPLVAGGTGALPVGTVFKFNNTGQSYQVSQAIADVSAGGMLNFWPPMVSTLAAATYTIDLQASGAPPTNLYFDENNFAPLSQSNAARNGTLNLPFYDATDRLIFPNAITTINASSPITVQAKPTPTTYVQQWNDSSGNLMFGIGGIPNVNANSGRGWLGINNQTDASGAGLQLVSGASGIHSYKQGLDSSGVLQMIFAPSTGTPKWELYSRSEMRIFNGVFPGTQSLEIADYRVNFSRPLQFPTYTVAQLNALAGKAAGFRAMCNDATAGSATFGTALVGLSNVVVPAYYDGTTWRAG